jgi:3-oxoacyl-[acyl-carrier protein] reductase
VQDRRLSGQTAIVTGGARGIGAAIARRLTDDGCQVVVWDMVDVPPAQGWGPAMAQRVDVSDFVAIRRALADVLDRFGRVEILVNNAGINGPVAEVTEYPLEAWDRVLAVDLTGVFYCCRVVVPHMRERGYGRIVTVASIAGKEGTPGRSGVLRRQGGRDRFLQGIGQGAGHRGCHGELHRTRHDGNGAAQGDDAGAHRKSAREDSHGTVLHR